MIKPLLQDDAFLASVEAGRAAGDDAVRLWWLGQSGFLVQWRGEHLLLDPYLSESLTKKYAATDKPHVRMTERVIAPERLDFVDIVTSSHNHTDHLDAETLMPIFTAETRRAYFDAVEPVTFVFPRANRSFVAGRVDLSTVDPLEIDVGETVARGEFEITAVPAAHEELRPEFLGYVVQAGRFRLYHSGDTIRFPGMAERLRPLGINVALLPINGSAPERRVAANLDGAEAAQLAHDIGARLVIPCHYEMFEFNTAPPDLFVQTCNALGQSYCVLRAGECWRSEDVYEPALRPRSKNYSTSTRPIL